MHIFLWDMTEKLSYNNTLNVNQISLNMLNREADSRSENYKIVH